jgi:hypothetical protein
VDKAQPTVHGFGLGDRLTTHAGDFFETVPTGADTHLLSMVLHDRDDTDATRLLTNIRTAASPGARVLAFELVMPTDSEPHMAKMIMLGMTTGRERTDTEMRTLFENAGLVYDGAVATPTPISIIEARVP